MPILGEFLSGPRAADGRVGRWGHPGQGGGVTFLGVKFNYPAGECVWAWLLWLVGGRLPVPSVWRGRLRTTEWASIIPSENGPCGWLHGLHTHSLTASQSHSPFSGLAPPPPPLQLPEKSLHNVAAGLKWILGHPCGRRTCGQHSQDVRQLVH